MRITLSTGTPAAIARPDTSAGAPEPTRGLVLFPDVFGLRPLFEAHAERLAHDHGWIVIVPELFPGEEALDVNERLARARSMPDASRVADAVAAAAEHFEGLPAATLGFCMGGMYAMKTLASERFDRAVAFYGMVRTAEMWQGGAQHDAIDTVAARAAAATLDLMCIFGTDDPWCPENDMDDVEALGATVLRYPEAGHGWAQDPDRDGYRPVEAADAWSQAEAFLAR
jgi:carboxymethylenebutenolidase